MCFLEVSLNHTELQSPKQSCNGLNLLMARNQFSMGLLCFFIACEQSHLQPLFQTVVLIIQWTTLEDRDCVFLQKDSWVYYTFIISGFPKLMISLLSSTHCLNSYLCVVLWESVLSSLLLLLWVIKAFVSAPGVFLSLPVPMKLRQAK